MAFAYLLDPQNQYMTKSGAINTAGIIRVFDASTDDPAVTYKDFNGTANPEAIVLDNNGRCVCIADADKAYRVEVYDRYNSLMWTTSPLWCEAAGGGVQLNITELVSSDGSVDLVKTTVGSTTTWDLSVAKDSTQMLEWLKAEGYTVVEAGHYLPTYSSGTMLVGEYGVALHANQYYHFTSHFLAVVSNPSDPIYDSIEVVFRTADAILYTKKFTVDCTTALPQEFEVSFDVMAGSDMEVGVFVGDIDSNTVSVGLSDMEVHRVYSGAPYIPDGIASREWVEDNYQEKLTAGANIVIEDNVISATAEPQLNADWDATSGVQEILNKPDLSVYARSADLSTVATTGSYDDLLDKPEIPEQVNADWDASSGKAQILHKPDLSVYAEKTELEDYQEKLTAGDNITIENNVISATGGNNFTTMSPVVAPPDGSGLFIQAGHGLQERVLDYMQYELPHVQVAGAEDEYTYRIVSPWKLRRQDTLNTDTSDSANSTVGFFLASNVPSGLSNCVVQWSCDRDRSAYIRSKTLLASTYSSTLRYVPCNSQLLKSNGYFFSIPLPKSVLADAIQADSRFDVGGDWSSYTGALPSMYFSLYNTVTNQYISLPHTDGEKMAVRKEYNLQIDYTKVQGKLTAGDNITISNNVISATAEPQVNADWDATSGVAQILNKPEIPPDNVFVATYNTTTYQELSDAHTAGKAIFVTNVSGALSAILPMTSFNTSPAMVMFSAVIGSVEYRAKIDQGVWSSTTVSMQADWDEASQLSPAYIANKPTIVTPVNADWDATSGLSEILNKPIEKSLVAGDNISISEAADSVTISATAAPQQNADWDATSGVSEILNKPTLATVATSGSYTDLLNTPDLSLKEDVANKAQSVVGNSQTDYPSSYAVASFVNSSVSTNTAKFLGNFTLSDLSLTYPATDAQIETALDGYAFSPTPTNNDYVYVEIQDPSTPGVTDVVKRFKFDGANWLYEYSLNNSSFTATEIAAIDSGINSTKVGNYDTHIADTTIHVTSTDKTTWNGKQDAISDLNTIRTGAGLGATAVQPGDLATVATSGLYSDLSGTPTIPTATSDLTNDSGYITLSDIPAQVNSDWDATSGVAQILNRPTEKELVAGDNITITESGSTVTISASASAAQVNADWDATSGVAQILNKPDLSIYAQSANLAAVATTGSYDDLLDKPAIPSAQINADWDATSGVAAILNKPSIPEGVPAYTTAEDGRVLGVVDDQGTATLEWVAQSGGAQADWDATSGASEILNKPVPKTLVAGTGITITETANDLTVAATAASYTAGTGISISAQNVITNTGVAINKTTPELCGSFMGEPVYTKLYEFTGTVGTSDTTVNFTIDEVVATGSTVTRIWLDPSNSFIEYGSASVKLPLTYFLSSARHGSVFVVSQITGTLSYRGVDTSSVGLTFFLAVKYTDSTP